MDLSNPKTWTDGISVVVGAPHIVFPLLAAWGVFVWWFRGTVEQAKRDGLQSIINGRDAQLAGKDAQIAAKDAQIAVGETKLAGLTTQGQVTQERLQLANDVQKDLTTKLADAKKESEKLRKQVEEKAAPEAIAATANSTVTLVTDSVSANTVLLDLLRQSTPPNSAAMQFFRKKRDDKPPSVTAPSE